MKNNIMKKIIIGTIIILILGIGLMMYLFLAADPPEDGEGGWRNILPFGRPVSDPDMVDVDEETEDEEVDVERVLPRLRQVTDLPLAGAFLSERDGGTYIRYIEKGEGFVKEINLENMEVNTLIENNSAIEGAYRAFWAGENNVMVQHLDIDTIETVHIKLIPPKEGDPEWRTEAVLLPSNISALDTSPLGNEVFYLVSQGSASGYIYPLNGSSKKIFSSPIREWIIDWDKSDRISITTKASFSSSGLSRFINPQTGREEEVLRNIYGLTVNFSPISDRAIISEYERGNTRNYIYNHQTENKNLMTIRTLPEKCVWSNIDSEILYCGIPNTPFSGEYPDTWYQGLFFFTDGLYKINTSNNSRELILDPEENFNEFFDMKNMFLNSDESIIFFTDKRRGYLWVYILNEEKWSESEDEEESSTEVSEGE